MFQIAINECTMFILLLFLDQDGYFNNDKTP